MSINGLTPNYNSIRIDMGDTDGQTAAGRLFRQQTGFIQVTMRDSTGAPVNNVQCEVALGLQTDDRIILDYNGKIRCALFDNDAKQYVAADAWRLFWQNQPGVFLHVVYTPDFNIFESDTPNPLQSFTSSIGTTIPTAAVSPVGSGAAVLLSAANSNRQSVMICNTQPAGGATLYIGPATVTAASGMPIPPGGYIVLDKNVAAVYGISGGANIDARVLQEIV